MSIRILKVGDTLLIPDSVRALRIVAINGDNVELEFETSEVPAACFQPVVDGDSASRILPAQPERSHAGPIQVLLFDSNHSNAWSPVVGDKYEIEVVVVREIEACLEHLVASRPDVLVIDTYSLHWRAESLLQFLSKDKELSRIPIILLGGALCGTAREAIKRLNVVNRMRKPVDADRLCEGVATMLAYQEWRSGRSESPVSPAANDGRRPKNGVWSSLGFRKRRAK